MFSFLFLYSSEIGLIFSTFLKNVDENYCKYRGIYSLDSFT